MTLTYPNLKAHLASGAIAPVYVLTGAQDLLREIASAMIQEAVLGQEDAAFNFDKFDGEGVCAREVVEACNIFPLLAGRRLVLVRRASVLVLDTALLAYLDSPSPRATLVLELEKTPDTRRKNWKQIERKAIVVQCDPLKHRELEEWIREKARDRGLHLGSEEVRYLLTEFGSDLRRQLSEIEKVSLYASGSRPSVEELAALLGRGKAQSIFQFTEALADRDAKSALQQLGRLLEEGESPLPILAWVDRTVGQLLTAKELRGRGKRAHAAGVLGVPSYKVDRVLRQSARFTEDELLRALEAVARCDRALKTTGVPARLLLEGLLISLC